MPASRIGLTLPIRSLAALVALLFLLCAPAVAQAAPEAFAISIDEYALLIDRDGEELTRRDDYRTIYPLYDERGVRGDFFVVRSAAHRSELEADYVYALMDSTGRLLTDFEYRRIERAGDGFFRCLKDDLWGVIDGENRVVLPFEYTSLISNGEGGYLALRTPPYNESPNGIYYINAAGEETATGVKIRYDLYQMDGGLMSVYAPDDNAEYPCGYINARGEWAIKPQFQWCGPFVGSFAEASGATGAGVIDKDGNWVITPKYNYVNIGYNGSSGETKQPMIAYGNGLLIVFDRETLAPILQRMGGGCYGYAGANGLMAITVNDITTVFDYAGEALFTLPWPSGGVNLWNDFEYVIVNDADYNAYLFDRAGNQIAGPYQMLSPLDNPAGRGLCFTGMYKTRRIYYEGSEDWDPGVRNYYESMVPGTYRMGLVDQTGRQIIKPIYDSLYELTSDRLMAETPQAYYLMDYQGNVIREYPRYFSLDD